MANIVELREMNGEKLAEMLENAREEMFNLRFQTASARLENYARVKQVRREIGQLETVLHMRALAKEEASRHPAIAPVLAGKTWRATARFNYEASAWKVRFVDDNDQELASAEVNLNKKQPTGRKVYSNKKPAQLVVSYEVAG